MAKSTTKRTSLSILWPSQLDRPRYRVLQTSDMGSHQGESSNPPQTDKLKDAFIGMPAPLHYR